MKVMHLITGLGTGGAEGMLERLLKPMDVPSMVVSMRDVGPTGERIQASGTRVEALGMAAGVPDPRSIARLVRLLRSYRPDILQTWMYHADLLGGVASRLGSRTPVVWNIRQSTVLASELRRGTLAAIRASAVLSRWLPSRIVSCSRSGAEHHADLGYAREKFVVIPNGFDLDRYRPDPEARGQLRAELGLPSDALLVGSIARFDPQKDHRTFIEAAAVCSEWGNAHFVLCGEGISRDNAELVEWIERAGLRDRVHLLGRREDVPRVAAGLDIVTSSSIQEGFPNVIGEAMACGVPCVVTDVGDSAELVGPTGVVVAPRDPGALAEGWISLLRRDRGERENLGLAARRRIQERFSISAVAAEYLTLYEAVAHGAGSTSPGLSEVRPRAGGGRL